MIFIDSSYWIAFINNKDKWHKRALELEPGLENEKRIISSTVLTETLNSLSVFGGKTCIKIYNLIQETHNIKYLNSKKDYDNISNIFLEYDVSVGFSDCSSLKIMDDFNIYKIASFDSDFDKINGILRIH